MKTKKKDFIYIGILILTFIVLIAYYVKNTYLYGSVIDWYAQHVSIPEYFRTLFYHTKDLLPDFAMNIGNGQNIYNFSYYGLLSPIILISYLFPMVKMVDYIMISTVIIVLISAILMYYFLKKHNFNQEVAFISSLVFLLATPIVFHSHRHIMFINYMPFLIMGLFGIDKKMKENKSWLLILSVFLMVMTSYYYSIGGILCLLVYALYLYLQKTKKVTAKTFFKTLFYIVGPILIGILMSSIITIPTLLAMLNNRLDSNVNISFWDLFLPAADNFKNVLYYSYGVGLSTIVIPALINFFKKDKANITIGIILVSLFLFNLCNFILNGTMYIDSKSLIPFLPLYVYIIAIFINDIFEHKIDFHKLMPALIVVTLYIMLSSYLRLHFLLEIIFILALILIYNKYSKKAIFIIPMFFLLLGNAYFHNQEDDLALKLETKNNDTVLEESLNIITNQDDDLYRTSTDLEKGTYANKVFDNIRYNNSTIYSSISNSNYNTYYYDIAANNMAHRNRALTTTTSNILHLVLTGNRYVITYNKPLLGYEQISTNNGLRIYKNNNAFPIGFANSSTMSYEDFEKLNFFSSQEALLNTIVTDSKSNNSFVSNITKPNIDLKTIFTTKDAVENEDGSITLKTIGTYKITYDIPEEYQNKILLIRFKMNKESSDRDVSITINGVQNKLTKEDWKYYNDNHLFDYVLSYQDQQKLNISLTKGEYRLSDFEIYALDYSYIEQASKSIDKLKIDREKTKGDKIVGKVNVTSDGYFMLTLPYSSGFKIKVDGEKTKYEKVDYGFIGFPIKEGNHKIEVEYKAPGKVFALFVSLVGLASYIAVIIVEDKRKI